MAARFAGLSRHVGGPAALPPLCFPPPALAPRFCPRALTAPRRFVVMSLVTVYLTPESAPGPVEQFTKYFASFTGVANN